MSKKNKTKEKEQNVNTNEHQTAAEAGQPAEETAPETPATETPAGETEAAENETVTLSKAEFEEVRKHIETLQKEKDETVALLQRTQADFENYRRRNASLRLDSLEEGKRGCITELLPVLDNFERAFNTECADENWKKGIELVERQLKDALTKLGLTEVETDGKFDPNLHNAVMQGTQEGKESGDILQVFQKGYRVGDKIVRYSMVQVAE
ncbi:MAG: nucleotide exchange factor GrpE [Clostridia bacterium]|nr:nucleotide exchange factor GrpE [Clostridia bacterium]